MTLHWKNGIDTDHDSVEYNLNMHWFHLGPHTYALTWLQASPIHRIGLAYSQFGFMEELPLANTFVDLWWQQFCPLRILLAPHVMPWEGYLISPLDVHPCLTQKFLPVLRWLMNSFWTATSSLGTHINAQNQIQGPLFPTCGLSSSVAR